MKTRYGWRIACLPFRFLATMVLISGLVLSSAGCEKFSTIQRNVQANGLVEPELRDEALRAQGFETPEFEKIRWIHRVARALRGGQGLNDPALVRRLLQRTDAEIIEHFLEQREFGDTVLDFNLKFLGFRKDRIRDADGELNWMVFDFPSALSSAKEVLNDGNYLRVLELEHPLYMPRLNHPEPLDRMDAGKSAAEIRARNFSIVQSGLRKMVQNLRKNPQTPVAKICAAFREEVGEGDQFHRIGLMYPVVDLGFNSNIWYGRVIEWCIGTFKPDNVDFAAEIEKLIQTNAKLEEAIKDFEPDQYSTRDIREVRSLEVAKVGIARRWLLFGNHHRQALMNSSTNFNRKRGAYILSRFFCDDLTPINVETPTTHTDGAHGSEPSCMACHYKLDPMSGFFRNLGYLFGEYDSKIRFDDNAATDLAEYQKAWSAPASSSRKWNVGYVRSTTRENLNVYGSTLEDLFGIIRSQREVKRCLVKRMFEYYNGESQALDAGYLDHLTEIFLEKAKDNSTHAFKDVTKTILLGKTYQEPDPVSDHCYDYPPGYDPQGKPPCKVAFILEKNCASCHDSTYDEPYLDLTKWERMPDGTMSFPHLDEKGVQRSTKYTLETILDRLTTADRRRRMPARKHMDELEREALFKWVNETLSPAQALMEVQCSAVE